MKSALLITAPSPPLKFIINIHDGINLFCSDDGNALKPAEIQLENTNLLLAAVIHMLMSQENANVDERGAGWW